jgi:hypothetical protein
MDLLPTDGRTVELMEWWFRFTLDASTEYLFGESVKSLVNPKVTPRSVPPRLRFPHLTLLHSLISPCPPLTVTITPNYIWLAEY